MELLKCMVVLFLILWRAFIPFAIMTAPVYIPLVQLISIYYTNSAQRVPFLHILASTSSFLPFWRQTLSFREKIIITRWLWDTVHIFSRPGTTVEKRLLWPRGHWSFEQTRASRGRTLSRGLSVRRPRGNYGGVRPVHGWLSLGAVISSRNVGSS